MTTVELDEYVFDGLRAGAAGFLVKDTGAAELIRAVRVVAGGEALLSPTVTRRLIAEFAPRTGQPRCVPGLEAGLVPAGWARWPLSGGKISARQPRGEASADGSSVIVIAPGLYPPAPP